MGTGLGQRSFSVLAAARQPDTGAAIISTASMTTIMGAQTSCRPGAAVFSRHRTAAAVNGVGG